MLLAASQVLKGLRDFSLIRTVKAKTLNSFVAFIAPPSALKLIGQLLGAMSEGRPVVLMPTEQEFTTVEAANFLNVSRPFVIKEMDSGRLPHRKVGSHRRIALEDLLAHAQKMRATQASALDRMAENARELGLDD